VIPVIFNTLAAYPLAAAGFPAAVTFLKGLLIPAFSHDDLQIKGYFRRRLNCKRILLGDVPQSAVTRSTATRQALFTSEGQYYMINIHNKTDRLMPVPMDKAAKAGLKTKLPAIDAFPNQFLSYEIKIEIPEFTSVCPKTGLPDFGMITIRYSPKARCLELKSLKEYIIAYRNLGIFYENAVNRILEDIVKACRPARAIVTGEFNPRGGIKSVVEARYPRPKRMT
jgi:7-cyano-7-deazaguanine reductase